jgi:hypothetical protein
MIELEAWHFDYVTMSWASWSLSCSPPRAQSSSAAADIRVSRRGRARAVLETRD